MGIEGGSNSEVQNQEINQANNEQNEINQAEHQRSGEELEGNSTIDNEGERKQIEGKDDATESAEDESSQLDKEDNIEDDPNTEQPPESDNVAPEQQLDNQDTIESDPSGADEMGEDNNETVDSLDNDDEIEDAEDLDDNQDSTEGDIQDSLDAEDSIDSDDTDDLVEEDDNNEQDPLDSEDSIEDDGEEESESPEGEEETENPEGGEESETPEKETENPEDGEELETPEEETENPEDGEESENPEGEEDTENPEDGEESESPEGEEETENSEDDEESESPEGEESENPKDGEESESPEGEEDTENPEDGEESENSEGEEDTENPEDGEESENPEGEEDTENLDGVTTNNSEADSDMNTLYSKADGESSSDGADESDGGGLNTPDIPNGPNGPDNPENIKGYKDIGEFNDELNKLYSDSQLSNQEKVEAAKGCVEKLNNSDLSPEDKKKSVDVPSDVRALNNPENSDWTERTDDNPWPPLNIDFPDKMGLDYDKVIKPLERGEDATGLPETAYRYGGEGGYNYTCEAADGHVPSLDERALPKEYVPEKDREVHFDNDRYCNTIDAIRDYESNPAASLESLNNMIDDINAERGTNIDHLDVDELEALSDKYKQLQDTEFADVRDELGIDDKDFTAYGVHGYAKPMEDTNGDTICEGGADQFNTALPEYMLKRIGVEY